MEDKFAKKRASELQKYRGTEDYTAEKGLNLCTSNSKAHVPSVTTLNLLDRLSVNKQKKRVKLGGRLGVGI